MASPHAAAAAAAPLSSDCSTSSRHQQQPVSFLQLTRARSTPSPIAMSSFLGSRVDRSLCSRSFNGHNSWSAYWVSPVNEVVEDGSSNAAAVKASKLEVKSVSEEEVSASGPPHAATQDTVSAFMADVANLIKLVDSRDIVELELKHSDYELLIRKKEALSPPPTSHQSFASPQVIPQTLFPAYPPPPPVQAAATFTPSPASSVAPAASVPAPAAELPPMLSPMAGTFYRTPAPGEPAFVKVGDKVQKGQVICIVEAMKLMNEIEADQTGTIMDIIAEDGKPVSIDSPLFVIKP